MLPVSGAEQLKHSGAHTLRPCTSAQCAYSAPKRGEVSKTHYMTGRGAHTLRPCTSAQRASSAQQRVPAPATDSARAAWQGMCYHPVQQGIRLANRSPRLVSPGPSSKRASSAGTPASASSGASPAAMSAGGVVWGGEQRLMVLRAYFARMKRLDTRLGRRLARRLCEPLHPSLLSKGCTLSRRPSRQVCASMQQIHSAGCIPNTCGHPSLQDAHLTGMCAPLPMQEENNPQDAHLPAGIHRFHRPWRLASSFRRSCRQVAAWGAGVA